GHAGTLAASQRPVLGGVVEELDRLDPALADAKELRKSHGPLWKVGVVHDRRLVAGIDLVQNMDRRLQTFDKSLEASHEPGRPPALACDRSLEVEVIGEDALHARLIE